MAKLNPVFSGIKVDEGIENVATVKGVAGKTFILLIITVISAILSINYGISMVFDNPFILLFVGIITIVSAIIGQVNPNAAKVASVIYSICEGLLLGLISFVFEAEISGIVLTAILLTLTIFGVMLFLYSTKIIKVTTRFVKVMTTISIAVIIMSLIYFISYIINPNNVLIVALTNSPGLLLLVSGFILLYGAFMLLLDFEEVNVIVSNGFDKKYEWTAALGLMVTVVWIYVQVLRLLAIFARRD